TPQQHGLPRLKREVPRDNGARSRHVSSPVSPLRSPETRPSARRSLRCAMVRLVLPPASPAPVDHLWRAASIHRPTAVSKLEALYRPASGRLRLMMLARLPATAAGQPPVAERQS